jgi:hypothetical protein
MFLIFCNIFVNSTKYLFSFFIISFVIFCNQRVYFKVIVYYSYLFKSNSVLIYILFKVVNITFKTKVIVKVIVDIKIKTDIFIQKLKTYINTFLYL